MFCQTLMMLALPTKSMDARPEASAASTRPLDRFAVTGKRRHAGYCDEVLAGIEAAWTAQVDEQVGPSPSLTRTASMCMSPMREARPTPTSLGRCGSR